MNQKGPHSPPSGMPVSSPYSPLRGDAFLFYVFTPHGCTYIGSLCFPYFMHGILAKNQPSRPVLIFYYLVLYCPL